MLAIDVELKPSTIHGFGIFTTKPLKKGDLIWFHHPAVDLVFEDGDVANFSSAYLRFMRHYGYRRIEDGKWLINSDLAKFTNHSKTPTSVVDEYGNCRAADDLPAGVEITEDYTTFAIGGCVDAVQ